MIWVALLLIMQFIGIDNVPASTACQRRQRASTDSVPAQIVCQRQQYASVDSASVESCQRRQCANVDSVPALSLVSVDSVSTWTFDRVPTGTVYQRR